MRSTRPVCCRRGVRSWRRNWNQNGQTGQKRTSTERNCSENWTSSVRNWTRRAAPHRPRYLLTYLLTSHHTSSSRTRQLMPGFQHYVVACIVTAVSAVAGKQDTVSYVFSLSTANNSTANHMYFFINVFLPFYGVQGT